MRDSILACPYDPDDDFQLGQFCQVVPTDEFIHVPGKTLQDKLNHLAACNCCARHCTNKPRLLAPWIERPTKPQVYPSDCECDCRHMARWICRAVEHKVDIVMGEEEM